MIIEDRFGRFICVLEGPEEEDAAIPDLGQFTFLFQVPHNAEADNIQEITQPFSFQLLKCF